MSTITTLFFALLSSLLSAVAAQDAVGPSNTTTYNLSSPNAQYLVVYCSHAPPIELVPLTTAASNDLASLSVEEDFVQISPSSGSAKSGDIIYLSCDPSTYSGGQYDAMTFIDDVLNSNVAALVLYSETASYCSAPGLPSDAIVFSTASRANAKSLVNITAGSVGALLDVTQIKNLTKPLCDPPTTANNVFGAPTTAVAMIILYSITGVITALFLIIIVSGSIRAHRHPERYGPRQLLGRPRQSRAKGIARAMLDTLPIVKFGDPNPEVKTDDVEMTTGAVQGPGAKKETTETVVSSASTPLSPIDEINPDTVANTTTLATADGPAPIVAAASTAAAASTTPTGKNAAEQSTASHSHAPNAHTGVESGIMCSICTDEFALGEDTRVLPCNHIYHPACVDPWLLNVSGTCPLCRIELCPPNSDDATADADNTTNDHDNDNDNNDSNPSDTQPSTAPTPASTTQQQQQQSQSQSSRRRSTFRTVIDRARMQRASPEERIAVLRRYREANRAASQRELPMTRRARERQSSIAEVTATADVTRTTTAAMTSSATDGGEAQAPEQSRMARARTLLSHMRP